VNFLFDEYALAARLGVFTRAGSALS